MVGKSEQNMFFLSTNNPSKTQARKNTSKEKHFLIKDSNMGYDFRTLVNEYILVVVVVAVVKAGLWVKCVCVSKGGPVKQRV